MNYGRPSASEVGNELSRYLAATHENGMDDAHLRSIMDRLLRSDSASALDALALSTWAERLLAEVLSGICDPEKHEDTDLAHLTAICILLVRSAVEALERTTGFAAEGFHGGVPLSS